MSRRAARFGPPRAVRAGKVLTADEIAGRRIAGAQMQIIVNGEARLVPAGQTVSELLVDLELDGRLVVVELNRQILRRGELADVALEPGDRVELVNFVGGG